MGGRERRSVKQGAFVFFAPLRLRRGRVRVLDTWLPEKKTSRAKVRCRFSFRMGKQFDTCTLYADLAKNSPENFSPDTPSNLRLSSAHHHTSSRPFVFSDTFIHS